LYSIASDIRPQRGASCRLEKPPRCSLYPAAYPLKTSKNHLVEQVEKPVHPATYEIIAAMVSTRRFIEDFFATKTLGVGMRVSLATPKDNCRQEIEAYLSILAQRTGIKWQNPEVDKAFEHAIEIADPREREKMVCVLLPHKLGAILFRVALWIPTPSPAADVITLVALDREGSNEEGRGEQAVLSATDPSPPENPTSLEAAYSKLNEMSELVKNIPPADLDEDTVRDIERLHEKLRGLRKPDKGRTQEGSTVLSVILSPATSRLLEQALIEGRIEIPEEIKLEWLTAKAVPRTGWSDLNITGSAEELRRFLRRAYHHESVVRPWRRLYSFLWPRPEHSPSASVLGDSADRTYSSEGLRSHWRSLYVDLKIGILVWPLVASMLIILSCLFAGWCGQPTNLAWGLATGLVLCLVGAQPCSYVVSPLGCHAGAVFVGWAFGFSQALLMGNTFIAQQITSRNMLQVPFKTITGGLVGLSAPHWRPLANVDSGFSLLVVVIILVCTATGIGMSGWLMGQAKKAKEPIKFRGRLPDWAAASVGFLAGGLIPVVKLLAAGLTAVFQLRGPTAFSCAFAVIGGITMACVVAWRSKQGLRKRRGIVSGIVHGVIAFAIVQFAFWAAQNSSTFTAGCAICAACGYFHATWFTAAYVIGEELSTTRGGVYATLLEGIPFYLAFLITEMLHKPIF
jgi:hypothetical protein